MLGLLLQLFDLQHRFETMLLQLLVIAKRLNWFFRSFNIIKSCSLYGIQIFCDVLLLYVGWRIHQALLTQISLDFDILEGVATSSFLTASVIRLRFLTVISAPLSEILFVRQDLVFTLICQEVKLHIVAAINLFITVHRFEHFGIFSKSLDLRNSLTAR